KFAAEQTDQRGFAAAVWPEQTQLGARREDDADITKQLAPAERFADMLQLDELACPALRGGEIDVGGAGLRVALLDIRQLAHHFAGTLDAALGFGGARLGATPEPLNFPAHAAGQRLLPATLGFEKFFPFLQEFAVRPVVAQESIRIRAPQLDDAVGGCLKEAPIVADDKRCERSIRNQPFQPLDSFD